MFGTIGWQTFCRWLKDKQWTEEKLVLAQCCCFWMLLISRGLGLSGESQKWPIHFSAYLWIFYISAPVVSTQLPTKSFRGFKIGWRGPKQRYDLDVMMSHGYFSNLKIDTLLVVSQVFLVNIDGRWLCGQCFIVFSATKSGCLKLPGSTASHCKGDFLFWTSNSNGWQYGWPFC